MIITDDLFSISTRVKDIDDGYFIVYDIKNSKYEVHNSNQKMGTFCLTLPFEKLDSRTINYVNKTRIENREKLILEIDKENEKIEKKKIENIKTEINKKIMR